MRRTQIRVFSTSLAAAFACFGSLHAQPGSGNQKCRLDKVNLQQLEAQLDEDETFLKNCAKHPSTTECQKEGPGIRQAARNLNHEIAVAMLQISLDCAPPSPTPPTPPSPALKLVVKDVSPDAPFGSTPDSVDQAGRVNSLVLDPHNDSVLYAATEMSGVWKSQDGAKTWVHTSVGLKTGLTQNHLSLAVDDQDSRRLLYATGDDDGRIGQSFGGLWVSNDAAATWQYGNLPCGGISSVVFSTGRPFVGTGCGIFSTTSQALANATWQLLPHSVFNGKGAVLAAAGRQTLFACQGNLVFRSTDLGVSWDKPVTLGGTCYGIAVVPYTGEANPSSVIVIYAGSPGQEVALVNLQTGSQLPGLGFGTVSGSGSGQSNVYAPRIASASASAVFPGDLYDIYVADGCAWFAFDPDNAHWNKLQGGAGGCYSNSSGIHVDTWAMAFASTYDPPHGICTSYASTDGGVFANISTKPVSAGGCTSGWVTAQSGLHAMYTSTIAALTGNVPPELHLLPPVIYLPTGDNDVWMGSLGGAFWTPFRLLGDSGFTRIDPAFPSQVLVVRNGNYDIVSNPPAPTGTATNLTPLLAAPSFEAPGEGNVAQVMTLPSETAPTHGDYVSVITAPSADVVVRNKTDKNPPQNAFWNDLSPLDHFLPGTITKIQVSGGHSALIVYVLTTSTPQVPFKPPRSAGQIWRGQLGSSGLIVQWTPAFGSGLNALKQVVNFVVNPYDPSEIYAADAGDQNIKVSRDSGQTWQVQKTLTDIALITDPATKQPTFRFDCGYPGNPNTPGRGQGVATGFFANACALADIAFDRNQPNVRVAVLHPGGLAFSNDAGFTWIPLDVTNANPATSNDLMELPVSAVYDGESGSSGVATIYIALRGPSLKAVTGPFPTLH
jgi:hypothetical protein